MKKIVLITIMITSFFIFSFNLNADTFEVNISDGSLSLPNPIGNNKVEVFNYFKEKKNNTNFYNLLVSMGSNPVDYILNNFNFGQYISKGKEQMIFVFTTSEYNYIINNYNDTDIYDPLNNFIAPDNSTHVIILLTNDSFNNKININDNSLNFNISGEDYTTSIYYFSDNNFIKGKKTQYTQSRVITKLLSKYSFSYNWVKTGWWIFGSEKYTGTDFAYLYSKLYYSSTSISLDSSVKDFNVILLNGCFNNTCYKSENLPETFGLVYNYYYPIISSKYGLSSLVALNNFTSMRDTLSPPNNYNHFDIGAFNMGLLFPKKSCALKDYKLYIWSNGKKEVDLQLHNLTNDDKISYQPILYSTYLTSKGGYILINPLSHLTTYNGKDPCKTYIGLGEVCNEDYQTVSFDDSNFIKYIYAFSPRSRVYDYYVYYNPECYTFTNNEGTTDFTFTNPQTGNDITVNGEIINPDNYTDPDFALKDNSKLSFKSIINGIKGITSSFIEACQSIVSMATSFFGLLPSEIQGILLAAFSIGVFIIIFKIVITII